MEKDSMSRALIEAMRRAASRTAPSVWAATGLGLAFFAVPQAARLEPASSLAAWIGTCYAAALCIGSVGIWIGEKPFGSLTARRILLALAFGMAVGSSALTAETSVLPPQDLPGRSFRAAAGAAASDSRRTARGNTVLSLKIASLRAESPGLGAELAWPKGGARILLVSDFEETICAGQAIQALDIKPIDQGQGLFYVSKRDLCVHPPRKGLPSLRAGLRNGFSRGISAVSGKSFPLAQALLLGVKDDLDDGLAELFRSAGCSHILALSGQHLSILCMLVTLALDRIFNVKRYSPYAAAGFALAFTWLAGPSPSLFRACLMALLSLVLARADRRQTGMGNLALTFCLAMAIKPADGRSLSFQLSYAAMAGLILLAPRWETFLWRLPPPFAKALAASLAALCATAPLSIGIFGTLYPGGILSASISGPLVLGFMWSLLASLPLGAAFPFLRPLLAALHESFQDLLLTAMEIGAAVPPIAAQARLPKACALAAIALLGLFVYCYPYMENALHRRRAARKP